MKFECNCSTADQFDEMVEEIHRSKYGTYFEVGARLWHTDPKTGKVIMVEHQITTEDGRELAENEDEPDWLTAYAVDSEEDDDCSVEIYTKTIESNIRLAGLKEEMLDFAKRVADELERRNRA